MPERLRNRSNTAAMLLVVALLSATTVLGAPQRQTVTTPPLVGMWRYRCTLMNVGNRPVEYFTEIHHTVEGVANPLPLSGALDPGEVFEIDIGNGPDGSYGYCQVSGFFDRDEVQLTLHGYRCEFGDLYLEDAPPECVAIAAGR